MPYSEQVADRFVKTLADCGVWAFQTEGLKLRVCMSDKEKAVYKRIGDVLGFDILKDYKRAGNIENGDYVYSLTDKRRVLNLFTDLAEKYGIKFFNADNLIDGGRYGCGCECCGTEFLRNHKIWGGCNRAQFYDSKSEHSEEFGKCLVNFVRSDANKNKTIAEVCKKYNKKDNAIPYFETIPLY